MGLGEGLGQVPVCNMPLAIGRDTDWSADENGRKPVITHGSHEGERAWCLELQWKQEKQGDGTIQGAYFEVRVTKIC